MMLRKTRYFAMLMIIILFFYTMNMSASMLNVAVKKTSAYILKKFGKGAAGTTVRQLRKVTAGLISKHGDECIPFIKNTGHEGIRLLQTTGKNAPKILHLYKRFGNDVLWLAKPERLKLILKYGDDAAKGILKHPGLGEGILRRHGKRAISVLNTLSRKNNQRLAILSSNSKFMRGGRASEIFGVLKREGNKAMDFIWRHKKSLAIATVLVTFLKDPSSYFKGAKTLIVDPVIEPVKIVARNIDWNLIISVILFMIFLIFGINKYFKRKKKYDVNSTL